MSENKMTRRDLGRVAGTALMGSARSQTQSPALAQTAAQAMRTYRGRSLRSVAMPLGGIGAGHYAIAGDGSLRQWQIFNIPNHEAFLPGTFFAVRVNQGNFTTGRILQTTSYYDDPDFAPAPSVNDHAVPDELRSLMQQFPGVKDVEFTGEYPIAQLHYLDDTLPVEIVCTVMTPMTPLDADFSGLPAVICRFSVRRTSGTRPTNIALLASLQNAVGYDGVSHINGVENHGYGGNLNSVVRLGNLHAIQMANRWLDEDDPKNGSMLVGAGTDEAVSTEGYAGWDDPQSFLQDFFRSDRPFQGHQGGTSVRGRTFNAGLVQRFTLRNNEPVTVTFYHAWHMPNFYVNWDNRDVYRNPGGPTDKSKFWVGKRYSVRYKDALDVARDVADREEALWKETERFRGSFYRGTMPPAFIDRIGSQISIIRSPTTFWDGQGRFFGFEGCNGASANWISKVGGCCPLNCTHVWNYEQSLAYLYPALERSMRETEVFAQQSPEGFIQHRVSFPLYIPRQWNNPQEGPRGPALDGMFSIVLRCYREIRQMPDSEWFKRAWPKIRSLLEHCIRKFDPKETGVIEGEQPNTYDISVYGPNTFIGSLYLAALRAGEEMARRRGLDGDVTRYRTIFERGREAYDRQCWNGEYYIQLVRTEAEARNAYGTGCHSDQLIGQWWALMLDLGYILPQAHVHTAVEYIFKYNFLRDFSNFRHHQRVFADRTDAGLLMATWPKGGRPRIPTGYCDEVWTGIEYEVAALCLYEGLPRQAEEILTAITRRYDGTRRNPWNEVECGDHYARAMSSYGVLLAASGFYYDAPEGVLTFGPRISADDFRAFYAAGTGWGTYTQQRTAGVLEAAVDVDGGTVGLRSLRVRHPGSGTPKVTVTIAGRALLPRPSRSGDYAVLDFGSRLAVQAGESLRVTLA